MVQPEQVADPEVEADRQDLIERSPLFHVDQIEAPLLVVHGANDPRVKQQESDQIVTALRDKDKAVRAAVKQNAGVQEALANAGTENERAHFARWMKDKTVQLVGFGTFNVKKRAARKGRNPQTGEWEDGETTFFNCSAWRDLGEDIAATISKGTRVVVTGSVRSRDWEDRDGNKRTSIEIDVDEVPLVDGALAAIEKGLAPGGLFTNQHYYTAVVDSRTGADGRTVELMYETDVRGHSGTFRLHVSDEAD